MTASQPEAESNLPESDDLQFDYLDELYRQALGAMDSVDTELDEAAIPQEEADDGNLLGETPVESDSPSLADGLTTDGEDDSPDDEEVQSDASRVTARQIIEAALFVGGTPLTTKKLCSLVRGEFDNDYVNAAVDELNALYAEEGRPYEIRFGEGGYRFALTQDYESVQRRVFGLGPKEIKLSHETLEVLALVAYQQPMTEQQVTDAGKENAGTLLRQLLRRELISLERGDDVTYQTTNRFLQLFGLGHLDELPQANELSLK